MHIREGEARGVGRDKYSRGFIPPLVVQHEG